MLHHSATSKVLRLPNIHKFTPKGGSLTGRYALTVLFSCLDKSSDQKDNIKLKKCC